MPILSAIQYKPRFATSPADVSDNFRRCEDLVEKAVLVGAELIVFPELAFTGYSFLNIDDAARVAEVPDGPTFRRISDLAVKAECYVAWGFVELDPSGALFNSASLVGPDGSLLLTNRKMNLWANDYLWATPGSDLPGIVQTSFGWTSVIICRDLIDKSPGSGRRIFSGRKIDLVAAPVNWSRGGFPATEWMDFAQNNSCTLAVANRWGVEENRSFKHDFGQGGSAIVDKMARPHIGGLEFGSDSAIVAMVDV